MTTKNKTRHFTQKGHLVFPIVLLIVCMVALAGGVTKVFQQITPPPTSTLSPKPVPHVTYTSNNLGVRFTYPIQVGGVLKFFTREIGNRIYLYDNYSKESFNQPFPGTDAEFLKSIAPGAFSVEVITKDPQQSLADAIKQQFLTGYSATDCYVNTTRDGHPRGDESIQTAIIDFPHHSNQTREQLVASASKCSKYVRSFDSVNYFMMDPKHPSKLLFVKIGQYNIPSGEGGLTWDRSITVRQ